MVKHSDFDRLIGATLGNYFLERLIEQSESGCIFIARNKASGTLFRLRILVMPSNLTPEDRIIYLGRVQQEANRIASLRHTHILPLVDYATYTANDSTGLSWPYLVSPDLPMKSLSAQLAQRGPVDIVLASRYLDQIASALEYTHQQGVLHRNLTTECIFVKQDGDLLVADFGVIHMLEAGARFIPTGTRKVDFGMSEASAPAPEQILGQTVDTYTDVYALGAVLYRMLTGHRVFRGNTREEIVQQHLQAPIPSLAIWRKDLSRALDDVIAMAMAKEPAQRYRLPGEFANAYHQIVAPNDPQRIPFPMAPVYAISGQPQAANPALNVHTSGSVQPDGSKIRPSAAPISRRRFIVVGGGVAAAVIAVAVFGRNYLAGNTSPANTSSANTSPANSPITNPTKTSSQATVLARTSDIPLNSSKTFPISGQSNPGLIIHLPDGRFVAYDSTCTHAQCAVNYSQKDKLLECPCHGAEFNPANNAAVVQGPAQTPLTAIKILVNADGTITKG
jgi:serine/threonine-protein kinase